MKRTRDYPSVLVEYTHTGSAINAVTSVDVNLARTALAAAVQAGIPVHLNATLKGTIEAVSMQLDSVTTVPVTVKFFANDTFDHFTTGKFLGDENAGESDFSPPGIQLQTAYLGESNIEYEDDDATGEFHIQIANDDAADNIADGDLKIGFVWRPYFPG